MQRDRRTRHVFGLQRDGHQGAARVIVRPANRLCRVVRRQPPHVQPQHQPGLGGLGQVAQHEAAVIEPLHLAQRLDKHTGAGHDVQPQPAQHHGLEQRQLLVETVDQVGRRLAVILLAAAGARHGQHQLLVEAAPQADRGGADAALEPVRALLLDTRRIKQAGIGLAVGQQDDA